MERPYLTTPEKQKSQDVFQILAHLKLIFRLFNLIVSRGAGSR